MRTSERGFTYLALLFALAAGAAALAAAAPSWQAAADREREAELAWRGGQIREALERYAAATPAGTPPRPRELAELLVDERAGAPRHWLRRLYVDPFTGRADWRLLRDGDGYVEGVASASPRPLRGAALPGAEPEPGSRAPRRARDWRFAAAAPPSHPQEPR